MTEEHAYADDPVAASEDAVRELRAALQAVGITLPSLGLDLVTYAQDRPDPLVSLGACHRATARHLAAVLRKAGRR
jgi:hypothetical protein